MTANTILNKQVTVSNERADGYNVAPANVMRKEYDADMTNKRFNFTDNGFVLDYQSEQKVLNLYDTVDMLNELNDENTKLKQENIELKLQLDICKKPLFSKRQLHQENQHIKHTIRVMMENERTEIGKNTLRQLWEAIQ